MHTPRCCKKFSAENMIFGSLLLLILIIPFDDGGNGHILQFVTRLIVLFCTVAWGIQAIRRGSIRLIFDRIDWWVLGFVVWTLISIAATPYTYATLLEVIKILTYIALFYLGRNLFPLKRSQKSLFLLAMLISSLLQFLLAVLPGLMPQWQYLRTGIMNPNRLACLWGIGMSIALSTLLFRESPSTLCEEGELLGRHVRSDLVSWCSRAAGALAASLLLVAIVVIKSRGALIGAVGSGLLLTMLKRGRWSILLLMLVSAILIVPLPSGSHGQRLLKLDDPYAYQRFGIWNSSLRMLADYPVFGVGPGLYRYFGDRYNFPLGDQVARYAKMPNMAHNELLQIGTEFGLPGLLLVAGILWHCVAQVWTLRAYRPVSPSTAAAIAGLSGLFLHGLFSNLLVSPAIAIMAVFLCIVAYDGITRLLAPTRHARHFALPAAYLGRWPWYATLLGSVACAFWFTLYLPTSAHIHYLQFYAAFEARNYAAAVNHLTTAIRTIPIHAYYHHDLGTLYAMVVEDRAEDIIFQEAVAEFSQAIRMNPENYEHPQALAELYQLPLKRS